MKKFIYFFIIILAFTLNACKDDDPVEPDPCSEYPEKMEIVLEQNRIENGLVYQDFKATTENEFKRPSQLVFSTNFSYDSTIWQIGNEASPRLGSKIGLLFDAETGEEVKIRAIGYRKVNKACFGESDTGIDTIYRTITFQDWWESPLFGGYRGTLIGESDSFTVMIVTNPAVIGQFTYYRTDSTYYQGIPRGSTFRNKFILRRYELFGRNLPNPDNLDTKLTYGRLLPEDRDILELSYWIKNDPFDLTDLSKFTFRGKRIN
jgi:hypothetical protein